jgi:hypothetical protein
LLHAALSTQNDWNGAVYVHSNRIGAPTMLLTEPFAITA